MTPSQEKHLNEILKEVRSKIDTKYRAGQAEHGGDLWERVPLIDDIMDEAVDQTTYALTLKCQLGTIKTLIDEAKSLVKDNPVEAEELLKRATSYL